MFKPAQKIPEWFMLLTIAFDLVLLIAGCSTGAIGLSGSAPASAGLHPSFAAPSWRGEANAAAVVCGLTKVDKSRYNGWDGDCPGCDTDAAVFALACRSNGISYDLLFNADATAANIERLAREAVSKLAPGGLLILYYSGHGGQTSDPSDPSETDGRSETICLWDGQLSDNVVWSLLCRVPPGIRVWMVTDSCHSGTNYRGPHDYAGMVRARSAGRVPDLLHWGGCADGKYSYGSAQGGTFTTALVDAYAAGQSYRAWFAGAAALMPANQRPTCESTGSDFSGFPAFR